MHLELLYHVDERDYVLGPIERRRAHRELILRRSGVVFLGRLDGKLLIQYRSSATETFSSCYELQPRFTSLLEKVTRKRR